MITFRNIVMWAAVGLLAAQAGLAADNAPVAEKSPAVAKAAPAAGDLAWAASQAPADAMAVVAIRSAEQLETNLKALVGPDVAEDIVVVKLLASMADVPEGALDIAGPVALFVVRAEGGPDMMLVLRIKDAAKLGGQEGPGGVLQFQRAGRQPLYGLRMGGWLAMTDRQAGVDALAAKAPGAGRLAMTDARRAAIGGHMIWAYVNMQALGAFGKDAVKQNPAAAPAPLDIEKIVEWLAGLADQAPAVEMAADVMPEAATATVDVALADGASLLALAQAGLPIESYKSVLPASEHLMVAAWSRVDWAKAGPPMKVVIKPFLDILAGADEAARKRTDSILELMDLQAKVMGTDMALMMEPAPPGAGMYRLAETFDVKDPAEFRKVLRQQMDAMQGIMDGLMGSLSSMPGMPRMKMSTQFKEAAETIEGLPVDVMTMRPDMEPPAGAAPQVREQMKQMTEAMYGPDGMVMRVAVVDKVGVVVLGDKSAMASAIKAARGQGPRLSADARVTAATARMPKGQSAAAVISLGNYIWMAMSMAERMIARSLPPEVMDAAKAEKLEPLAPPQGGDLVTMGARMDGKALRIDIAVPQSEVRAAITVAKQAGERIGWYMRKAEELRRQKMTAPAAPASSPAPAAPASPVAPALSAPPASPAVPASPREPVEPEAVPPSRVLAAATQR